ncbi:MAG TPA: proton-conducting transporter membrane subunit [Cyclobacteriaceae bacterium]|nr:proton-conducting transporter membrane subunit [Cyclobacteriaceae bacterium]
MTGYYLIAVVILSLILFLSRDRRLSYLAVWCFILFQWTFTFHVYNHKNQTELGYFTFDPLGVIFLVILSLVSVPALYHSYVYFNHHRNIASERGIYYSAMLILIASLSAAYLSNHIGVTWIFVELTTLSASALIYHRRTSRTLEATWKYIFVCSISITLVFIGILFVSIAIQQEGLKDLSYPALNANASRLNVFWLKLAFLFIFTGFTAKAGVVPMYTAGIDAKDKAPSPAGALFASVLMNVGFLGIYRFYAVISHTSVLAWANNILIIAGLLSVFVAAVYILRVKNVKRMLAYSGLEHMGLVMISLASGGLGYYAAVLHLILHSLAKPVLFFQVGQVYRIYKSKNIYDIGNYFAYNTSGAMVLLLAYFTITAMPPSGLFISEFLIFTSVFESGKFWLLAIILFLLTLIIWSQGKNFFKMIFIKTVGFKEENIEKIKVTESVSQFLLLAMVVYLGLNPPGEMVSLIHEALQNLPYKK